MVELTEEEIKTNSLIKEFFTKINELKLMKQNIK